MGMVLSSGLLLEFWDIVSNGALLWISVYDVARSNVFLLSWQQEQQGLPRVKRLFHPGLPMTIYNLTK
jgi:hypothetical protein